MKLRSRSLCFLALAFLFALPQVAGAQGLAFAIPPASGTAGGEVAFPVQFHSGGAQVCAVSADASFDASKLAFVAAEAGPAGAGASKNLVSQPMGSGAVRLALIGYNSIPISDGVVFTVRLRIQAGASGNTGVTFRGGAATCAGQDLPAFGATAPIAIQGGVSDEGSGTPKGDDKSPSGEKGTTTSPTSSGTSTASGASSTSAQAAEARTDDVAVGAEEKEGAQAADAEDKPLSAKAVLANRKGPSPLKTSLRAQVEGGKKPYEYIWDFGDDSEKGKKLREAHSYAKPGTYKPTLTVKDSQGDSVDVSCDEVTVQEPPVPELTQATLVPGEESWSLELTGKKFQKGSVASVNGKEYPTEFADATRLVVKGLADPKGAEVKVAVTNPYGKACPPLKAATKPEAPKAPGA